MSAFIVSKNHIDLMVGAALHLIGSGAWVEYDLAGIGAVGQFLWDENYASVNHRYGEKEVAPNYEFTKADRAFGGMGMGSMLLEDIVAVLKAISCYEYQSCEHDGWENSQAREWCNNIRLSLISHLPGYHDAPWEV